MCAITFSRPRWLMPSTICSAPACAAAVEHAVQQRNQRGHAFERKSLAAQIARLQHLLEKFRANQPLENVGAIGLRRVGFQSLGNPAAALGIVDVHEFRADRAAIEFARRGGSRRHPEPARDARSASENQADRDSPQDIPSAGSPRILARSSTLILAWCFRHFDCFLASQNQLSSVQVSASTILSNVPVKNRPRNKFGSDSVSAKLERENWFW